MSELKRMPAAFHDADTKTDTPVIVGPGGSTAIVAEPPKYPAACSAYIMGVLRAGVVRRIRVNTRYIAGVVGEKPWRVVEILANGEHVEEFYDDVRVMGESCGVVGIEKAYSVSCGKREVYDKSCAWVETTAEIHVR